MATNLYLNESNEKLDPIQYCVDNFNFIKSVFLSSMKTF